MNKYKIEVVTKQRYRIFHEAVDEETAINEALDIILENPEGHIDGIYDKFLLGPDVKITEIKETKE